MSYDDRSMNLPLRTCARCQQPFYMVATICARCGPGWRDTQEVPEPRVDVSGYPMDRE